jgi:predicted subunit of tRNA(5-methylaminomethyl-2-thiouridylate) methyltransferase
MFDYYNSLGARSYYQNEGSLSCFLTLDNCLTNSKIVNNEVDPVAVLSILMKNYSIGTRTLIAGVERTPWMSRPDGSGGWIGADLPEHQNIKVGPEDAAKKLHQHLRDEALAFIEGKKTIGILLSGGMDSRIVAGVVRQLQEQGDFLGDVVALTWGLADSRDVIYAQKIANAFDWEFKHFPLSAEVLARNIELGAERGVEYSPVHLHAMEAISKTEGLDGVLAGSYGDSIGRGEYSGRSANKLPGILDKHLNHFSFLLRGVERQALPEIKSDLLLSRQRFSGRNEASYRELEMQMHYMRRQLNACMEVIDDSVPLYQMFGSPGAFGFMWSLSPECRSDDVYEYLLFRLPRVLQEIPWARTGKKYNQNDLPTEDVFSSLNNRYGEWLRNDLRKQVLDLIGGGALQRLGIFNEKSLDMWSKHWPTTGGPKADRLDEKMAWLASLAIFVEKYNVQGVQLPYNFKAEDSLAQAKAYAHTSLYHFVTKSRGLY